MPSSVLLPSSRGSDDRDELDPGCIREADIVQDSSCSRPLPKLCDTFRISSAACLFFIHTSDRTWQGSLTWRWNEALDGRLNGPARGEVDFARCPMSSDEGRRSRPAGLFARSTKLSRDVCS